MKVTLKENQLRQIIKEALIEISPELASGAISSADSQKRIEQRNNMIKNRVKVYNGKYAFKVTMHDSEFVFGIESDPRNKKFFVYVFEITKKGTGPVYNLTMDEYGKITPIGKNLYDFINSPIGYVIDNLKAGPRAKLRNMCNVVNKLNGEGTEENNG